VTTNPAPMPPPLAVYGIEENPKLQQNGPAVQSQAAPASAMPWQFGTLSDDLSAATLLLEQPEDESKVQQLDSDTTVNEAARMSSTTAPANTGVSPMSPETIQYLQPGKTMLQTEAVTAATFDTAYTLLQPTALTLTAEEGFLPLHPPVLQERPSPFRQTERPEAGQFEVASYSCPVGAKRQELFLPYATHQKQPTHLEPGEQAQQALTALPSPLMAAEPETRPISPEPDVSGALESGPTTPSCTAPAASHKSLATDPQSVAAQRGARSRRSRSRESRDADDAESGERCRGRTPLEAEGVSAASSDRRRREETEGQDLHVASSMREDSRNRVRKAKSVLVMQKDELLQSSLAEVGHEVEERPISRPSRSSSPLSQARKLTQSKADRDGSTVTLQADSACIKCRNVFLRDEIFCRKCGQRRESGEASHWEPPPTAMLSRPSSRGNSRPPSSGGQTAAGRPPIPSRPESQQASTRSSRLQMSQRPATPTLHT